MKIRKPMAIGIAAGILGAGLGGGTAVAVLGGFPSGQTTMHVVRTQDAASVYNGSVYQTFAVTPVVVPNGTSRLITARFTGESQCTGSASSWCSVRILVRNNSTGSLVEMFPRSGSDFAFDAGSTDNWESNSVERVIRLGAGSYSVWVQRRVVNSASFRLDDWTFTVDTNL